MSNIDLRFNNYASSKKQNRYISCKMDMLLKYVPCNSRIFLNFDYKDKIFDGKLKVNCDGKSFFASHSGDLLPAVTVALCKKIQRQVMRWKQSRTVEEITGVISLHSLREESVEYREAS